MKYNLFIIKTFLFSIFLMIVVSCSVNPSKSLGKNSDLKIQIIGTWQMCNVKDSLPETNYCGREGQKRYKIITPQTFTVIDFYDQPKVMYAAFMGSYTIESGYYTEFLQNTGIGYEKYLGEKNTFSISINKDFMSIKSVDNKYSPELWKKVK